MVPVEFGEFRYLMGDFCDDLVDFPERVFVFDGVFFEEFC